MSLINNLIQSGNLKSPEIIDAFKKIKRKDFLLPSDIKMAEINSPIGIGCGQTISQPLTVAFMLELLKAKIGDKVLDVGSGSGWTCAMLAEIVGSKGDVFGIEKIPELKKFAEKNIDKYEHIKNLSTSSGQGCVQMFCSDGYKGLPRFAPFDKIIVAAAAVETPSELLKQLKVGGRLVIPIGLQYESQEMVVIDKVNDKKFREKRYPGFIFVPLVKE
ncbi:MAG: protein-L-isoaspartate O-methyltransferase [Patescibacteria group bacterium]